MMYQLINQVPVSILKKTDNLILTPFSNSTDIGSLQLMPNEHLKLKGSIEDGFVTKVRITEHLYLSMIYLMMGEEMLGYIMLKSPFDASLTSSLKIKLSIDVKESDSNITISYSVSEFNPKIRSSHKLKGSSHLIASDKLIREFIKSTQSDYNTEDPKLSLASGVTTYKGKIVNYLKCIKEVHEIFLGLKNLHSEIRMFKILDICLSHHEDPEIIWSYMDYNNMIHIMSGPTHKGYYLLENHAYPKHFLSNLVLTEDDELIHLTRGSFGFHPGLATYNDKLVTEEVPEVKSLLDQFSTYYLKPYRLIAISRNSILAEFNGTYYIFNKGKIIDLKVANIVRYEFFMNSGILIFDGVDHILIYNEDRCILNKELYPFYQEYYHEVEDLPNYDYHVLGDKIIMTNDDECILY